MSTPCNPCDRLPKRLSCCDCLNLIKVGCLPVCGLTGIMIPMPHLHICGRFQGNQRGSADLCRRCCGGEDGCGDTSASDTSCCVMSGTLVKSCKRPGDPPEKDDIWCHMRCSTPINASQICRRCCGDGECGVTSTSDCKCCQTIQQRMNF